MIVPITGNVNYPVTLDPTVWIFDDRKIIFQEAFSEQPILNDEEDDLEKAAQQWDQEVNPQRIKPPVNKSISKFEREKILVNTYVMPIHDFIENAEIKEGSKNAILHTSSNNVTITLEELKAGYLLFAVEGKPIKEDGPVHFYFKDRSKINNPIKGVQKISII